MRFVPFFMTCLVLVGATAIGVFIALVNYPWTTDALRTTIRATQPSIVLDAHGRELMRFQRTKRNPVPLQRIPVHLVTAFLATEDRAFYEHPGISWMGIIRSLFYNMYHRRFAQGGSTITQQLVRLLYFDTKKTIARKIKEQFITLVIEQQLSKDQILEAYLNHIYLGCGIYGVAAAAHTFWGKSIEELTVGEAALIAGIVQSPRRYCPLLNPDQALKRRNVVLHCMATAGYITLDDAQRISKEPLSLHIAQEHSANASHIRDMIRAQLEELIGRHDLYNGGLTIKTTIDQQMQIAAETCFSEHITKLRASGLATIDGAIISIRTHDGGIEALVGGYSYQQSQFNRALHASRQIGSALKPFVYSVALEQGLSLADVEVDAPMAVEDHGRLWQPVNVTHRFDGPMTRARALIVSNNIITLKTILEIGPDAVAERGRQIIPTAQWNPYPSLALGCVDMTPLQAVSMFNIFANRGNYCEPYLIEWINDGTGKRLWTHAPRTRSDLSWRIASQIGIILEQACNRWNSLSRTQPLPVASMGKTGTTNDARSCWFLGSTPSHTTAVYLGSDDYRAMPKLYAVSSALPLWHACNLRYPHSARTFQHDPTLTPTRYNSWTGEKIVDDDNSATDSVVIFE